MTAVLSLVNSTRQRERLTAALPDDHVIHCESWEHIEQMLHHHPADVIVFDPTLLPRPFTMTLRHCRKAWPECGWVMYAPVMPSTAAAQADLAMRIFQGGQLGVSRLLFTDATDVSPAIATAVHAGVSNALHLLLEPLRQHVSARSLQILRAALQHAHDALTPDQFARAMGVSHRALNNTLYHDALPSLNKVITWSRLVAAARMLEHSQSIGDHVARRLRFASGSAFRNLCRRYLGVTPQELRSAGGAAFVVSRLLTLGEDLVPSPMAADEIDAFRARRATRPLAAAT